MKDCTLQFNFVGRLSLSISSNFDENSLSVRRSLKSLNNSLKPIFWGSRSFKVIDVGIDVGTLGKLVSSACYDMQQVCVYLKPFGRQ